MSGTKFNLTELYDVLLERKGKPVHQKLEFKALGIKVWLVG